MDAGAWVSLLTCVGALGGLSFIVRPALRARDEDPMFRPVWLVLLAGGAEGRRPDDADDGDWRRWPTSPPRIPPRGGTSDEYGWRHTRRSIQKTRATQRHAERRQEALGQAGLRPKTSPVLKLHEGGVRAVRLDLYRGGPEGLKSLERWALGVHELARWHVELYEDSKDLPDLEGRLAALPKVTIDHLGVIRDSYPALLRLIEKGAKVKAPGFGRVQPGIATVSREISAVDRGALVSGTDLPGTRACRPFEKADADLIFETLGERTARRVLYSNAVELYSEEREKEERRG